MANTCFYNLIAVAPKKETLKRLVKIMKYKDKRYYIYRCFDAVEDEITFDEKSNLYYVGINGEVAWSTNRWFESKEDKTDLIHLGYENNDFDKPIFGTAHYISLDLLCKRLKFGLELFAEENGCCFQQHYSVNSKGTIIFNETAEWVEHWCDDDGNELDEPYETGGLDNYNEFGTFEEIYGERS